MVIPDDGLDLHPPPARRDGIGRNALHLTLGGGANRTPESQLDIPARVAVHGMIDAVVSVRDQTERGRCDVDDVRRHYHL